MIKSEYIKQIKKLIKKYHPDLNVNEHSETMYNEITKKLVNILNNYKFDNNNEINSKENRNIDSEENALVRVKEQDYAYYKLGIKYYKNIHPDIFYKKDKNGTYITKSYEELVSALNNIFLSFNLSEYYFKKLIEEFPKSSWLSDSKDKIKLLKKLKKRYENITMTENEITNYTQFISEAGLNIM